MHKLDLSGIRKGPTEGVFSRYEIPSVLMRVARQGRTGRLTLTDGDKVRSVGFAAGTPTMAGSNIASERLGRRLLKLHMISDEQCTQVEAAMAKYQIQFGTAMVRLGLIRREELKRALVSHHAWIISQCMNAGEVECSFVPFAAVARDPDMALLQSIEDGVRAYGHAEMQELLHKTESWRFAVDPQDADLARRLGCPETVLRLLERLAGAEHGIDEVRRAAALDEEDADAVALSLVLSGMLVARPASDWQVTAPGAGLRTAHQDLGAMHAEPPRAPVPLDAPPAPRGSLLAQVPRLTPAHIAAVVAATFVVGIGLGSLLIDDEEEAVAVAAATPEPALQAAPPPTEEPTPPVPQPALAEAVPELADVPEPDLMAEPLGADQALAAKFRVRPSATVTLPKEAPAAKPAPVAAAAPAPAKPDVEGEVAFRLKLCAKFAQLGDYKQVLAACREVVTLDPKNAPAYRHLGVAYSMLGAKPQACESYRRYLRFAGSAPDKDRVEQILKGCE